MLDGIGYECLLLLGEGGQHLGNLLGDLGLHLLVVFLLLFEELLEDVALSVRAALESFGYAFHRAVDRCDRLFLLTHKIICLCLLVLKEKKLVININRNK